MAGRWAALLGAGVEVAVLGLVADDGVQVGGSYVSAVPRAPRALGATALRHVASRGGARWPRHRTGCCSWCEDVWVWRACVLAGLVAYLPFCTTVWPTSRQRPRHSMAFCNSRPCMVSLSVSEPARTSRLRSSGRAQPVHSTCCPDAGACGPTATAPRAERPRRPACHCLRRAVGERQAGRASWTHCQASRLRLRLEGWCSKCCLTHRTGALADPAGCARRCARRSRRWAWSRRRARSCAPAAGCTQHRALPCCRVRAPGLARSAAGCVLAKCIIQQKRPTRVVSMWNCRGHAQGCAPSARRCPAPTLITTQAWPPGPLLRPL